MVYKPSTDLVLIVSTLIALVSRTNAQYTLMQEYSGSSFFDAWDFFTGPDPTNGFVTYVDNATAASNNLIGFWQDDSTNEALAYIGVDYTKQAPGGRESVRISTTATWSDGALFIADVRHMPLGICSVWPAWWAVGPDWPNGGEIDIIEGVNTNHFNQMTLHTSAGCTTNNQSSSFIGTLLGSNCGSSDTDDTGCGIVAPGTAQLDVGGQDTISLATAGTAFNDQQGAVYAALWNASGISVFMFPHAAVPTDLSAGSPDPSSWTARPLAQFGGTDCDFMTKFSDLVLVFDTTFCGDWAGNVWSSSPTCAAQASTCEEFVANNPSAFKDAYWLIGSVKVYQDGY